MPFSYKCPNCAANLLFDPDAQKMRCAFCDAKISPNDIVSRDGMEGFMPGEAWDESTGAYVCENCGAEVLVGDDTMATFCLYCSSSSIIRRAVTGGVKPNKIIPFTFGEDEARRLFLETCEGKKLLPRNFANDERIEKLKPIYIPVWLYDYAVDVDVEFDKSTGSAGKVNCDVLRDPENVSKNTLSKFYRIISSSRLFSSSSEKEPDDNVTYRRCAGNMLWTKIPVEASEHLDESLFSRIEPYNYDRMHQFETQYLSGFFAEKSGLSREEYDKNARDKVSNYSVQLSVLTEDSLQGNFRYSDHSNYYPPIAEYGVLPVWFLNYNYFGKKYGFAINGQTGRAAGDFPVSIFKFSLLALGLALAFFGLGYLLSSLLFVADGAFFDPIFKWMDYAFLIDPRVYLVGVLARYVLPPILLVSTLVQLFKKHKGISVVDARTYADNEALSQFWKHKAGIAFEDRMLMEAEKAIRERARKNSQGSEEPHSDEGSTSVVSAEPEPIRADKTLSGVTPEMEMAPDIEIDPLEDLPKFDPNGPNPFAKK